MSERLCLCGAVATTQALYRRADGSHFLGDPYCDSHRVPIGPLAHTTSVEVVDHIDVRVERA